MKMTTQGIMEQLEDMLDDGIATCGSMDPAVMDEMRAVREALKKVVMQVLPLAADVWEHGVFKQAVKKSGLNKAWTDFYLAYEGQ